MFVLRHLGADVSAKPAFSHSCNAFPSHYSTVPGHPNFCSVRSVMPFAQLLLGPPGSGKSTYCNGMHQFLSAIGRKCSVVNLDPANDALPYPCALDIRDLVKLEDVMRKEEEEGEGLGPNGGVMWAMEELEERWTWLEERLKTLGGRFSSGEKVLRGI